MSEMIKCFKDKDEVFENLAKSIKISAKHIKKKAELHARVIFKKSIFNINFNTYSRENPGKKWKEAEEKEKKEEEVVEEEEEVRAEEEEEEKKK
jgi:hypothetical protein